MQPSLRSHAFSLALCSMFGGCRSASETNLLFVPLPEVAPSQRTRCPDIRRFVCALPHDEGEIVLNCTFPTTEAERELLGNYRIDSVQFAPSRSGAFRLEVYNLISANSYRTEMSDGATGPVNSSDSVVYAARTVDERVLVGREEGFCDVSNPEVRCHHVDAALRYRVGVPATLRSSLWIEIFTLPSASTPERLVGALSVASMWSRDLPWTPSAWPEDPALLGSDADRITKVRQRFVLFEQQNAPN